MRPLFYHARLVFLMAASLHHAYRTRAFQLATTDGLCQLGRKRTLASLFRPSSTASFQARRSARERNPRRIALPTARHSSAACSSASETLEDVDVGDHAALDPRVPYFPIYYNDVYEVKLPPGHRFPMEKYRRVREKVQGSVAALSSRERSLVNCEFHVSPLATFEELTTTHSSTYVTNFLQGNQTEQELRNVGFPWSESGVKRALSSVGGTVAAARAVCNAIRTRRRRVGSDRPKDESEETDDDSTSVDHAPVWSAHIAGGTHHAFFDRGEGFCVFSDIAVAANVVLQRFPDVAKRILILDLDVHQGNGNAVLFQGRNDVVTFSMHCSRNYFSAKEQSDLDIELPEHCTDQTYLSTLNHWLNRICDEGGQFDLVFYQAGVDIIDDDRLGRMALSTHGVQRRNELVYDFANRLRCPLVITMGGGYPQKDWEPILNAHASVYFQAHQFLSKLSY